MTELRQGSNEPLTIEFDVDLTTIQAIEVSLRNPISEFLHWSMDDVIIYEKTLILPLSEENTMDIPVGKAELYIKLKDEDGLNRFAEKIYIEIVEHPDKTPMDREEE